MSAEPSLRPPGNAEPPIAGALAADQLSGDLLCPFCGEALIVDILPTDVGTAEAVGVCKPCNTIVDIEQ